MPDQRPTPASGPATGLPDNTPRPPGLAATHLQLLAAPPVSLPEELLLDVHANDLRLLPVMQAYLQDGHLYLPLVELATALGLQAQLAANPPGITINGTNQLAAVELRERNRQLEFIQEGHPPVSWPAASWLPETSATDDDFYLRADRLQQIWPVQWRFNLRQLRLQITTLDSFPRLEALARTRRREMQLQQQRILLQQPADGLPYRMASAPLVNWYYQHAPTDDTARAGLLVRHDLGGLGQQWQLQATRSQDQQREQQLNRFRWQASYLAAEQGQPQPLGGWLNTLELGDLQQPQITGVSPLLEGRGLHLSSFANANHSVFDTHRIHGLAPPGWEADLYVNQQLVEYRQVEADGTYSFEVALSQGFNRVDVHLYGPYGETRVDQFTFVLDEDYLSRGEWALRLRLLQPGETLFGLETDPAARPVNLPRQAHELTLGIGLGPALSLQTHWYQQSPQQQQNLLGWTLQGQHQAIGWQWRQLFDRQSHFSRLQLRIAPRQWQLNLTLADHPDWAVYQQQLNFMTRQFEVEGNYSFDHLAWPLRVGTSIGQQHFKYTGTERFFSSFQQFRQASWAFNLRQQCRFTTTHPRRCEIHNLASQTYQGLRLNLRTSSYQAADWLSHTVALQLHYPLASLLEPYHPLGRGLAGTASYGLTHDRPNDSTTNRYAASLTWQQAFAHASFGWRLGWDTEEGWQASLQLSGTLLPGRAGYAARSEALQRPVELRMYHDRNYNGQHDEQEETLAQARFRQGYRLSQPTDPAGTTWMDLQPRTALDVDYRSLPDPYLVSGRLPLRLASRPERVVQLDWPVIETGAIEGLLSSPAGQPLVNQRLELHHPQQGRVAVMYTAFDGFWVFEFIPPGQYQLLLEQQGQLILLGELQLTAEDPWQTLDLVYPQP